MLARDPQSLMILFVGGLVVFDICKFWRNTITDYMGHTFKVLTFCFSFVKDRIKR